jgi:putative ABC transport system permease protein
VKLSTLRSSMREGARRVWGALRRRRSDADLERELAAHLAFVEDELLRRGHSPAEAARRARAGAGGRVQALEALRDQRGIPLLGSSWLDVKLGARLLVRSWGLTLVGGLAMTIAIGIAAVVFAAFDTVLWSPLPLDEGKRVVALQAWDREAGRRVDVTSRDVERWRTSLQSVVDVGAFQTLRRNVITSDGAVELAPVAEISAAGFRVARVAPLFGRSITDADEAPGAPPVVVLGFDVWKRRFGASLDVLGRPLRLGDEMHTVVGVMPEGFEFPLNFRYWVPLRGSRGVGAGRTLHATGPEGVVFGRLARGATLARAHAEVSALGALPSVDPTSTPEAIGARVVPYTFAFTGDFESGELGFLWSMASLLLVLLLIPPCANIAILNYARTITRQQEFAARLALGGSRARIVWQLLLEALVLTTLSAGTALLVLRVVAVVANGRLENIPGGPPFWMTFGVSIRTLLFVAALAVVGAAVSGLAPALQATRRVARLGATALGGRNGVKLGATWTALVIAQVAFSVGVLPLAAQLAWGTLRSGIVGPGFAAEEFATARVALEGGEATGEEPETLRRRAVLMSRLKGRLASDPNVVAVAAALEPPGEEPWVFVDVEGQNEPIEVVGGQRPGFLARFNQVEVTFFDLYPIPSLAGRRLDEGDVSAEADAVVVNRNFAETIAGEAGHALGRRFRYVTQKDGERVGPPHPGPSDRWYQVVGVVGNLPVTTDARVAYHATTAGQRAPAHLQLRLRNPSGSESGQLAQRLLEAAARVDPALHVDQVRTLDEIYREHRFGDNLGAITLIAVTASVLLLSAAGLYALMAFTVAQRRREIGIRTALGAPPSHLLRAVFRKALWQISGGAAVGLLGALLVGRYVPIETIGGLPIPGVLPGAVGFMLLVGVFAALGPARRGLRADPTEALR